VLVYRLYIYQQQVLVAKYQQCNVGNLCMLVCRSRNARSANNFGNRIVKFPQLIQSLFIFSIPLTWQSVNQIRIFNVGRITGVITKSTKAKSLCRQLQQNVCKWSVEQVGYVFSLWQKSVRETDDVSDISLPSVEAISGCKQHVRDNNVCMWRSSICILVILCPLNSSHETA